MELLRRSTGAVVFFFVLAAYSLTLYPGVGGGDSGEITLAAATLGVAHPPGYPLHSLLGYLVTQLLFFIPSVAVRVNAWSAICGAGAASILFVTLRRWVTPLPAFIATLLFAFSTEVWTHSTVAEVFALNHLLVALLIYSFSRWCLSPHPKWAWWGAFWAGLALSNHHTALFVIGPIGLALLFSLKRLPAQQAKYRQTRFWIILLAAFGLGLTPYFYLFIRGSQIPPLLWGDFTSWQGFLTHVLRREYGTFKLSAGETLGIWGKFVWLGRFVQSWLLESFAIAGIAGALALRSLKQNKNSALSLFLITLTGAFVLDVGVFHILGNLPIDEELGRGVQARFWQLPFLIWTYPTALGIHAAVERFKIRQRILQAAAVLVLILTATHSRSVYVPGPSPFEIYARYTLQAVGTPGILLTRGDYVLSSIRYLQLFENFRTDVAVIDQHLMGYRWIYPWIQKYWPSVKMPGTHLNPYDSDGFSLRQFLDANRGSSLIYAVDGIQDLEKRPDIREAYVEWPIGFARLIVPINQSPNGHRESAIQWDKKHTLALDGFPVARMKEFPATRWESTLFGDYFNAWMKYADRLVWEGEKSKDPSLLLKAAEILDRNVQTLSDPSLALIKNAGTVHSRLVRLGPEHIQKARDYWSRYVREGEKSDRPEVRQDVPQVRGWLKTLPPN